MPLLKSNQVDRQCFFFYLLQARQASWGPMLYYNTLTILLLLLLLDIDRSDPGPPGQPLKLLLRLPSHPLIPIQKNPCQPKHERHGTRLPRSLVVCLPYITHTLRRLPNPTDIPQKHKRQKLGRKLACFPCYMGVRRPTTLDYIPDISPV